MFRHRQHHCLRWSRTTDATLSPSDIDITRTHKNLMQQHTRFNLFFLRCILVFSFHLACTRSETHTHSQFIHDTAQRGIQCENRFVRKLWQVYMTNAKNAKPLSLFRHQENYYAFCGYFSFIRFVRWFFVYVVENKHYVKHFFCRFGAG